MIEFFREGGWGMWFVLIFGLTALGAALAFAARPDVRRVATIRDLTYATVFSTAAGIAAGFAAVGSHVPMNPEWANSPKIHLIVMKGISESLASGILGFTILALTWMVMAVGHRRLGRETPA